MMGQFNNIRNPTAVSQNQNQSPRAFLIGSGKSSLLDFFLPFTISTT